MIPRTKEVLTQVLYSVGYGSSLAGESIREGKGWVMYQVRKTSYSTQEIKKQSITQNIMRNPLNSRGGIIIIHVIRCLGHTSPFTFSTLIYSIMTGGHIVTPFIISMAIDLWDSKINRYPYFHIPPPMGFNP